MNENHNTALQKAVQELISSPTVNIKGKNYTQVSTRINIFRKYFPQASIETFIIHSNDSRVIIQTKISIEGIVIATGYAQEVQGNDNPINATSMIEVCETSSIGRALANFGLGGSEYASSNEVENVIAQQNQNPAHKSTNNQMSKANHFHHRQNFAPYEFQSLYTLGLQIEEYNGNLIVTGDKDSIFQSRDAIKAHSFHWSSKNKCWFRSIEQQAA